MKIANPQLLGLIASAGVVAACQTASTSTPTEKLGTTQAALKKAHNDGAYNLHLEDKLRLDPIKPGSDAVHGRQLFGLAEDLQTSDPSGAIISGPSVAFGGNVEVNGRTCFTCHRGKDVGFGLPKPPLTASVPLEDPLFTGIQADAGGDPTAFDNLDNHALIRYRANRFNLARDESDPYRRVFGWRKSVRLLNVQFSHGLLTDGRARNIFEADRGAFFSHTQTTDKRFDDLFPPQFGNDMEAFQFSLFTDPALAALRDPSNPNYATLANQPFSTVHLTSQEQRDGKRVFKENCMACHNTPNVFNNISNVNPLGDNIRPITDPAFAPHVGRDFNVGISERNKHNLLFSSANPDGTRTPVVLPLANEDGTTAMVTVTYDLGLAMTTGRSADIGRFKVPQLRGIKDAGPYFHDNSADTLEEVVDYFNSPSYNNSKDGRLYPIHMSAQERAQLLAFLYAL
jgi:cytochrome c peroxidase